MSRKAKFTPEEKEQSAYSMSNILLIYYFRLYYSRHISFLTGINFPP